MSDRLTLYEDLIISDFEDSLLDAIGVFSEVCYKKNPGVCKYCNSEELEPLEVLGARVGRPLFWECQSCDYKYLIYSRHRTERFLAPAIGCWTVGSDWGWRDESDFN